MEQPEHVAGVGSVWPLVHPEALPLMLGHLGRLRGTLSSMNLVGALVPRRLILSGTQGEKGAEPWQDLMVLTAQAHRSVPG